MCPQYMNEIYRRTNQNKTVTRNSVTKTVTKTVFKQI